jgi:hypothetical protein
MGVGDEFIETINQRWIRGDRGYQDIEKTRCSVSLLECERNNCGNLLCRLLVEHRYVCNECADEFRELVGDKAMPIHDLSKAFRKFMESYKSEYKENRVVTVDEFLGIKR